MRTSDPFQDRDPIPAHALGRPIDRRTWLGLTVALAGTAVATGLAARHRGPHAPKGSVATVYANPDCGCCTEWVKHLEADGYQVFVSHVPDVTPLKVRYGVPEKLWSCHTALIDGYVIEGHVPADLIDRLRRERLPVTGLAVPGMPAGAPGMEGPPPQPYQVIAFARTGTQSVFAQR